MANEVSIKKFQLMSFDISQITGTGTGTVLCLQRPVNR